MIIVWRIMNTSYSKRLEEFFNHHLAGVHIFLWSTKVKHQEKRSMKARYFQAFLFWHYLIIFIVFPDANIWICQFHVMQAILQWDKDHGDVFEPQPHLKLSLERKHSLLKAVHTLQHCWFVAWWDAYIQEFETLVQKFCEGSPASARDIIGYFHVNWFSADWRDIIYFNQVYLFN